MYFCQKHDNYFCCVVVLGIFQPFYIVRSKDLLFMSLSCKKTKKKKVSSSSAYKLCLSSLVFTFKRDIRTNNKFKIK